jgi:phage anti-repressor protein
MSWGGIKRTAADIEFSKAIRLASEYCERCGAPADDCSHYFGRRKNSTRYAVENCSALCRGCHNFFGEHPHDHHAFMVKKLGEGGYDLLVEKARSICKVSKKDRAAIARHYRLQQQNIKDRRANGETGILPIESYQ